MKSVHFQDIYTQHKNLVYNLALQYTQNKEDAEEIAQDVFIAVYDKLNTFKAQSKLQTWVYRITINKSLDFMKAKKRRKRSFFFSTIQIDDVDKNITLPDFNHPGVLLEQKEEIARIFRGINQLAERQKTVIILLKIEQKTQAETAAIMELSTKAVESLYQRAKKKLEKILK
ncbi:MAG: RNA polymerase sigma factor [Aureispira sp.]|nr:RNA polymerase sigma factor [Aureispira sp.]